MLDTAYTWLCTQRQELSHNNDVWNLRADWALIKPELQQSLLQGDYRFAAQTELRLPDGIIEYWSA
ncbi:MAG: hypothetical protein Q3M30_17150 [Candidatus Electrothrix sp. Rat3]|nr:hypothetical protein [Candidatus Electrothrix rattekaaiensis]